MTALWEVMLDVARLLTDAPGRIADSGTTTTLVDAAVMEQNDYYTGGALFITSGSAAGSVRRINSYKESTFTFDALATAIVSGAVYVVTPPLFTADILKNSVNSVLKDELIIANDTTFETVANQESYELPDGVFDIVRVEVADSLTAPYLYKKSYNWYEVNGYLYFDDGYEPASDGFKIRLWYRTPHGELAESGDLSDYVDLERIKWGSVVFAYRNLIERIRKDNPTALDLMNEAKTNEQNALTRFKRIGVKTFPRDAHFAGY